MKTYLRRLWIGLLAVVPVLVLLNLALFALRSAAWQQDVAIAEAAQYDVEIIRDAYGTPHIYGKRDVDVAFGLSYAHAEDDFKTMQQMIPFYRGQLAREIGLDGAPIDYLPANAAEQARIEPVYETLSGWGGQSSFGARSWADLPAEAVRYVRYIEELIGAPVTLLSTSPERDDTILVKDPFED